MELINDYLKDLVFIRVEDKEGYAVYAAKISGLLGAGKSRYALAFVPIALASAKTSFIHNLRWQNVQLRTLQYGYRIKRQVWKPPNDLPDPIMEVKSRQQEYSRYLIPGYPFEILLLHNPRKKTVYQYQNKVFISSAIGEFDSLFNYVGDPSIFDPPKPDWSGSNIQFPTTFSMPGGNEGTGNSGIDVEMIPQHVAMW